jgi:outer membrane protein
MRLKVLSMLATLFLCSAPTFAVVLSIDDCVNMVLATDQSVLAAQYALDEAHGNLIYAKSKFFPTFSLSASVTKLSNVPYTVIPAGVFGPEEMKITMGTDESVVLGATLVQPLWMGGRVYNGYQMAKTNESVAEEGLRLARSKVVYSVRQAFYGLLLAKELTSVTSESLTRAEDHYSVAKKRYDVGLAPKFEMLRAEVTVTNLQSQLAQLENGAKVQEQALRQLINLPAEEPLEISGTMDYMDFNMSLDQCQQEASANRPELAQMDYQLEIMDRNLKLAKANDNPMVSFIGAYKDTGTAFFDKDSYQDVFSATLNISWPIFDSFGTHGLVLAAHAKTRELQEAKEQLNEGIILEVEANYRAMESSRESITAQTANISLAQEALSMVEAQYDAGLATNLDVMDTQLTLHQAEIAYKQAMHDYLMSIFNLYKAMGRE